jgi:hypothetical protein
VESALSLNCSLQSVGGCGKSSLESIANHFIGVAAVGLYGMAEDSFLAGEGKLHGRRVSFPAFGAPLYIGEQEGHRAGWRVLHKHHYSL